MGPYNILIGLSLAVILSYLFDLVARTTKLPAVFLLLLTGIALRQASDLWGLAIGVPQVMLAMLGIVGLIMIVLEGALDLHLDPSKNRLVRRAFLAAFLMLVVQTLAVGGLLHVWLQISWQTALLNAVPLAVVSSAIAIPSVASLGGESQEFTVYESTFSDILGIMLFNFLVADNFGMGISVLTLGRDVIAVGIVAIISTALLAVMLDRLRAHVKFFLLFAFLLLIYALAKKLHLSSLVVVFVFGLTVNNIDLLPRAWLQRWLNPERVVRELHLLKSLTAESAFLIRTFFFLLFGFSITLSSLLDWRLIAQGVAIVAVLTLVRLLYLKYFARVPLFPTLFIAPKGLITVLLFYSIPKHHLVGEISENILFVVIILTALLMLVGLLMTPPTTDSAAAPSAPSTPAA